MLMHGNRRLQKQFDPLPGVVSVAAFILCCTWTISTQAEDWPQWRGPNRDGVCGETGLLQSFPAEGLKVRWRVPVGWGFFSPVVAQGRVYLADSELVKPRAKERLYCFDESTGKVLWTYAYDVAYEDWAFDPTQEIGPVATAIVHDGQVYSLERLGHLFCLDARKGEVLWQRNLEKDYGVAFAPGTPFPLIEGNLLILLIGGSMFQLDADKPGAAVLWPASKAPSRRIFSHTSTALFRGDHLFSAKSSGELVCVEAVQIPGPNKCGTARHTGRAADTQSATVFPSRTSTSLESFGRPTSTVCLDLRGNGCVPEIVPLLRLAVALDPRQVTAADHSENTDGFPGR